MKTKIYLLPGIMCNEQLWSKLLPCFDESYELVHVPLPMKNSMDLIVDALSEVFEEEKVKLVGFSLGGYIASYFACKYPHRIEKLFIMASSMCTLSQDEIKKRKETLSFIQTYGFKGLSRKKIISLLESTNQNNEPLIQTIEQMYIDLGEDVFKMQMGATLYRNDLSQKLSNMPFPMSFFYSDKDRLVNQHWMQKFSQLAQNAVFTTLPSSSHMLPLEKPLAVSQGIKRWLKEQS